MKNVYFVFQSEKSFDEHQNIIRDILYCTYGIRIESCLDQDVNLNEIMVDDNCLLIFTEVRKSTNGKCAWLIEGLNHKDLIKEIEKCMI